MIWTILAATLLIISTYFCWKYFASLKQAKLNYQEQIKTYQPIEEANNRLEEVKKSYATLQNNYRQMLANLKRMEKLNIRYNIGVGTADPERYITTGTSRSLPELEQELAITKDNIKKMVKDKKACICEMGDNFTVNGKKSEAKKLFNREVKLRLRCFDNEVNSALALADWNNINRLIERIRTAFADINDAGRIVKTFIQKDYLELRIKEVRLAYEVKQLKADLKEDEREERRMAREAEREEARIKASAKKAEEQRKRMEKLVEKELANIEKATEEQRQILALHQQELELLRQKEARAISMAQLTRSGYVYIISNVASFGEGVCKIGMTRRVDPQDRVNELGDASVPEQFCVHAFIYSEDAPKLEKFFHEKFSEKRVNMVNRRKEFFSIKPEEALKVISEYSEQLNVEYAA
ncbi:MAG: DUF4041 domain-containing protein [Methylophaga sp.]